MNNFEDKNLFDDDLDLLSESADSLFGANINKTPEKSEEKKLENNSLKITKNTAKKEENNKKQERIKKNTKKEKKSKIKPEENLENNLNNKDSLQSTKKTDVVEQNEKNNNLQSNQLAESKNVQDKESEKKQKNNKTKKPFKWKLFLLILIPCLLLIISLSTFLTLYIKDINTKLATPTYEIYQRQTGTIISIDKINKAISYEINVYEQETLKAVFISDNNLVELKTFLNQPGEFTIKIRALGKTEKATSDFSEEKSLINIITLSTPQIFKDNNIITWNPILHAEKYLLFYCADLEADELKSIEIPQNEGLISFDLSALNIYGPGLYPVCVQAITNLEYYKNSEYSNVINYEYFAELQNPIMPELNMEENILSFMLSKDSYIPNSFKVRVTLENNNQLVEYTVFTNEINCEEIIYNTKTYLKYTANLKEMINDKILKATMFAVSDSSYSTNSDIIDINLV